MVDTESRATAFKVGYEAGYKQGYKDGLPFEKGYHALKELERESRLKEIAEKAKQEVKVCGFIFRGK